MARGDGHAGTGPPVFGSRASDSINWDWGRTRMSGTRHRVRSLTLVVLVVGSLVAMAGPVSASSTAAAQATALQHDGGTANGTFAVKQGDQCYEVTALGDCSQTVEAFYNYSTDYEYSSAGTKELQDNQVSN